MNPASGQIAPDFAALFSASPDLYLVLQPPDFKIVAVSDNYLKATLTQRDAILGRGLFEVFPDNPDDPAADGVRNLKASLGRALKLKKQDVMPLQKYDVQRPDGSGFEEKYWLCSNSPVLNAAGEISYLIHRAEDVTETVISKRKAAESERRLQTLLATLPCVIYRAKAVAPWPIDYISAACEEITGYSAVDFLSGHVTWGSLIVPEDAARVAAAMPTVAGDHAGFNSIEYRIRHREGAVRWLEDHRRFVPLPGGGAVIEGVRYDVTARKAASQELKDSENRYRMLSEAMPIQVWTADPHGGINFVNEVVVRYFGLSEKAVKQDGWMAVVHPDDLDRVAANWLRAMTAGVDSEDEARLLRHDGAWRWHIIRRLALRAPDGRVLRWFGTNFDIDETRQARVAAEEAANAKAAFLSSMSHEIRTPMNAIIGMTSILQDTKLTPEQQDAADVIRNSGEHLLTVINDILDYSKIEAGKIELEHTSFSLRDCIESATDLVANLAAKKGVEIGYLMQPGVPEGLLGDVGRVRQVLVNLLSNAVKFTPADGQVIVEVAHRALPDAEHLIEIAVKDTGIGIAPEVQARLFKPFEQGDASTTRIHGGTGLGLSISRRLVELMRGTIGVTSTPGGGSTFTFTFKAHLAGLAQLITPMLPAPTLKGRRVLVVDDLEINRRILRHYAQLWEMVVFETASPEEALNWVTRGDPFDLALVDYHMPVMDGLALARAIRRQRSPEALPILILSSVSIDQHDRHIVNGTMLKPLKPSRLLEAITSVLRDVHIERHAPAAQFQIPANLGLEHPLRILIAEDNAVNQKVAQLLFKKMRYTPDFVSDGKEAVDAVTRQVYDVVFMDVRMPVMDGLTATREICRRQLAGERPRIIGMSANAMEEDRQAALHAGMNDYVPKPVQIEQLATALRLCVRRDTETTARKSPAGA